MVKGVTDVEQRQALVQLDVIGSARRQVRRHSLSNGVIPLVWGTLILLALPLFDVIDGRSASVLVALLALAASGWTAWYARSLSSIQPSRSAVREYLLLILGWAVYYVAVMVGGDALVVHRVSHGWFLIAPFASAPLLLGGLMMRWRVRR